MRAAPRIFVRHAKFCATLRRTALTESAAFAFHSFTSEVLAHADFLFLPSGVFDHFLYFSVIFLDVFKTGRFRLKNRLRLQPIFPQKPISIQHLQALSSSFGQNCPPKTYGNFYLSRSLTFKSAARYSSRPYIRLIISSIAFVLIRGGSERYAESARLNGALPSPPIRPSS